MVAIGYTLVMEQASDDSEQGGSDTGHLGPQSRAQAGCLAHLACPGRAGGLRSGFLLLAPHNKQHD